MILGNSHDIVLIRVFGVLIISLGDEKYREVIGPQIDSRSDEM